MRKRPPAVIDAEFFVVGEAKPKKRRLYLAPTWWVIALFGLIQVLNVLTRSPTGH
jgi:hypothetical protein